MLMLFFTSACYLGVIYFQIEHKISFGGAVPFMTYISNYGIFFPLNRTMWIADSNLEIYDWPIQLKPKTSGGKLGFVPV